MIDREKNCRIKFTCSHMDVGSKEGLDLDLDLGHPSEGRYANFYTSGDVAGCSMAAAVATAVVMALFWLAVRLLTA